MTAPFESTERSKAMLYLGEKLAPTVQATPGLDLPLLLDELVDSFRVAIGAGGVDVDGGAPAAFHNFKWVIRDEDLKFAEAIMGAAIGGAGAMDLLSGATAFPVAVATAVGILSIAMKRKLAQLAPRERRVLAIIAANREGLTDKDIVKIVARTGDLDEAQVKDSLALLAAHPTPTGVVALIAKAGDSRWRTTGL